MKKILIIIFCLLLCGCNYIELNDMGIVALMGIKYDNDVYNITVEVEENKKDEEPTSLIYHASGSSLEKAIQEVSLKIDKELYFIDLNVILLDSNTVNKKLTTIVDFITREVSFGTNFNILVDDDFDNSITLITDKEKIAGEYIRSLFDNSANHIVNNKYYEFLRSYLNPYSDVILPYGKIQNNDYVINEAVIFKEESIVHKISMDMIDIYNMLYNVNNKYLFQFDYKNKNIVFKVSNNKSNIKYKNNKIIIDIDVNGSFIEIEDLDLDSEKIVQTLINLAKDEVKSKAKEFINECIEYDSDILKFRKYYYNKARRKISSIKDIKYEVNVKVNLNREGLIFNSLGDVYETK